MAARLWEKTEIEPFAIWQWSSLEDTKDYEKIVDRLMKMGDFKESVLLIPPPSKDLGFQDSPYGLAAVDAIVIHPPYQGVSPARRTVLFPQEMNRVTGMWKASRWPVVISAYRKGEPVDAVPLDQIMLRRREKEFVLWVPKEYQYEIQVFDKHGQVNSTMHQKENALIVDLSQ
jgi:hypothetical protein